MKTQGGHFLHITNCTVCWGIVVGYLVRDRRAGEKYNIKLDINFVDQDNLVR